MNIAFGVYGSSTKGTQPWNGSSPSSRDEAVERSDELIQKVLVVDDEPDLAYLAAELLTCLGFQTAVVLSAPAALMALQNDCQIDAVFSDVMMPGMSGLQLADAVREIYPRVKIVLTSGYTLPEVFERGDRPYLFAPKPYRIDTVLKLLRT